MRNKYLIVLMFIIMGIYSNIAYGYINIYPTSFKKNITNGVQDKFYLYNRTEKVIKYRVYLEKSDENDMSEWIEIYPKSVTLKPLEEKEIRIAITPPQDVKNGKYKSKLVIKQVGIPGVKYEEKVNFMTMLKMTLVGYIGENNNDKKSN
ncbi:hypothetical protein [Fusobacterium sp.]|uniref:hypothetical protein n=1 Tax=Fusobacterium sp. TaxID=68766 RepID=UPI000C714C0F|nr:hypothetical protein [Fusobacterium sp.]